MVFAGEMISGGAVDREAAKIEAKIIGLHSQEDRIVFQYYCWMLLLVSLS